MFLSNLVILGVFYPKLVVIPSTYASLYSSCLFLDPEGVDITSGWQNVSDSLRKGYHGRMGQWDQS